MNWKFTGERPVYQQIVATIRAAILTGEYPPGMKVPSVRDLAAQAQVNPNTMQRALAQLESEGLVYSQRTAGRFVTEDGARIGEAKRDLAQRHVARFMEAMRSMAISREETLSLLEAEFGKETGTNECPDM